MARKKQRTGSETAGAASQKIINRTLDVGALRDDETMFKGIIEHVTDIFFMLGADREMLYISPQCERVLGYPAGEVRKNWARYVTDNPLNADAYEATQLALETGDKQPPYLQEFIHRDGTKRLVEINESPLKNNRGEVIGIVGAARDMTEHKRIETALRESEERYRLLSEHTTDSVTLMDTSLNILYVSPSVQRLRGFSPQEVMELPQERNLTPESLDLAYKVFSEEVARSLADPDYNPVITLDLEYYCKDGSTFWAETKFSVIWGESGTPVSILSEARDITGRKKAEEALRESEERYRSVVENAHEAIFIAADGMFKFANSRAAELTGYSLEELTLRPFTDLVHPDDRQMVIDRHFQRLKGIDLPNTYVIRAINKSGDTRWVELTAVPITWKGSPAILSFMSDITDRNRLEEELKRLEKLESVGRLAGGIAHDFNNILTAILGNISLARMETSPGSELNVSLEQAEKASLRAKDLTVQLLTFAKGGAPVKKLAPLPELLRNAADFALRGSNVKCLLSIADDLWPAEVDPGQISQVIRNLVINAQQAMPGGGTVELRAENMALGETQSLGKSLPLRIGNYVRISVVDHGDGIPKEQLAKIFEPFFTTRPQGSGMGLATAFSIVQQHGGLLSVESKPGAGSVFYVYLPTSVETANLKQGGDKQARRTGGTRVLVMDDEKTVREVAGRMLRRLGYREVEFATDGAGAVTLYKAAMESGNPFSVVILDLTIPGGMGGEAAIRELIAMDPRVKALVSSGYVEDPAMAEFGRFGFSGTLPKPYTIEEFGRAVQEVAG